MSDDREQTKGSMDAYRVAEERFLCDINNLIDEYGESTYENLDSTLDEAEQMLSAWKPMFEHFLYECLYYYEQTDENRVGILLALQHDMGHIFSSMAEGATLLDELCQRINLYFRRFKLESYIDCGNEYIQEILELPKNNCYKKQLIGMIMHSFFNDNACIRSRIESLSVNYYFEEVMPREDIALAESRYKIKNDIPVFSDVNIGQVWKGRNRTANFIRALHLTPKPAGKNSRKAQEKSIARSCEYTDDKKSQALTLVDIYQTRREKIRKERIGKYEPHLRTLLHSLFWRNGNTILNTTLSELLKKCNALPITYRKIPLEFYHQELLGHMNKKSLAKQLNMFHEIVRERLVDIVIPVLEKMACKLEIAFETHRMVVMIDNGRKVHISEYNPEQLGMEEGELSRLLNNAEEIAIKQLCDTSDNSAPHLNTLADVIAHGKLSEYKKLYDGCIRTQYGWSYTYRALKIHLLSDNMRLDETIERKAKAALNELIVDAITSTLRRREEKVDTVKESSMQTPLDADAVACFIRYELSLNVEAQERFAQWGRNSNKNPPTYAPK